MKKIVIAINNFSMGGIQKALVELLKQISKTDYEITLFCCEHKGELLEMLPNNVYLLPENPYAKLIEQNLQTCRLQGRKYYFLRFVASAFSKIFSKKLPAKWICSLIGRQKQQYDIAISFSQPINSKVFCNLTNEIILNCFSANQKMTFLHCDFEKYGGNSKTNRQLYHLFDKVATVSDSVGRKFIEIMPELEAKVCTVRNCIDREAICKAANENPVVYSKKTLVSVCRLSPEKGLMRCVSIMKKLREKNIDFQWHIIGDGPEICLLKDEITRLGLVDIIIVHGKKINPYRYMRNANFLLLPSFHEASPIVYDEARVLHLPVLTTKTLSAIEIVGEKFGLVCENNSEAIEKMLERALSDNLEFDFSNDEENKGLEQFITLCK